MRTQPRPEGLLIVYGPFRYSGQYTSHSNHAFDDALRRREAPMTSAPYSAFRNRPVVSGVGSGTPAWHALATSRACATGRHDEGLAVVSLGHAG